MEIPFPKPNTMSIVIVSIISFTINIILGKFRTRFRKMTFLWWLTIHASIPLIVPLRIWFETPAELIPLFIILSIAGQITGGYFLSFSKAKNEPSGK